MRKRVPIFIIGIITIVLLTISLMQTTNGELRSDSEVSTSDIKQFMQAQVDIGPRYPGSEGSTAFKGWLYDTVPEGWSIEKQNFTYLGVEVKNYWITNEGADVWPSIMIGAHYDSRKVADQDSENPTAPVPGANDGASGVAAILEMMDHITPESRDEFGFVLFDAEDQGSGGMDGWEWIVGSEYFANQMTQAQVDATEVFILYDMIADDDLVLEYEGYSNRTLSESIWKQAHDLGYDSIFKKETGVSLIDDHRPFLNRGIDSVDIIDFNYPEWHTTDDDMEHVSAENAAIVVDVVLEWLYMRYFTSHDRSSSTVVVTSSTDTTEATGVSTVMIVATLVLTRKISTYL